MTRATSSVRRDGGWSIFETMVAIGIIATGLMVLVQQLSISFRESNSNENRAFAYQKAAALLGELKNSIMMGRIRTSDELYALADKTQNPVLTTRRDGEGLAFAPDHPMSGNSKRRNQWQWARRIGVSPHENTGLYYCRIEIDHLGDDDQWHTEASHAQLFSLVPSADSPEQVHDVYVLACSEAPSLWSDLGELRSHLETAAGTVAGQSQARVRLHWITRLGYGRDPCYAPFVNTVRAADSFAPAAYWLPGALAGAQSGTYLYRTELLAGMHRTELGLVHGLAPNETVPSTIADQNNHCLRTPAAWRLFDQRVAAGLEDASAPPLQLLLDDMNRRPEVYRNAIFVNLHGRGLPVPPLRNYSDAAKDPINRSGVRVVTHPARLWTPRDPNGDGSHADTQAVELRVYGWRTAGAGDVLAEPILVKIFGPNLTGKTNVGATSTLLVNRLQGGIDLMTGSASSSVGYVGFDTAGGVAPKAPSKPGEMWFEAGYVAGSEPYTWLRLYNTPLVAPAVGLRGLAASARLYGCEYVPSPVSGSFARDLATDSATLMMRNTARWRIRIPSEVFSSGLLPNSDQVVRVVTQIGTDAKAGQRWPTPIQPLNSTETWTWWSQSKTAVPVTERAQFLGDPRLCPYEDLMNGGASYGNAYNWHFDDLVTATETAPPLWPCFDAARLQEGFAGGPHADAPRLLQLLRDALQGSGNVLVQPVDRPAHTLLLGGEIAAATPTGSVGVTMHADYTGGTIAAVDTIEPSPCGALVLQRTAGTAWWAKPWLGELFPDDLGSAWIATGNLPLGGSQPLAWHRRQGAALPGLPFGTDFAAPAGQVMGAAGAVMLANIGTLASTVGTGAASIDLQTADPASEAITVATNLVPPVNLTNARTVALGQAFAGLLPAFAFTDAYPRATATLLENTWHNPAGTTGLIAAWAGAGGTAAWSIWTADPTAGTAREVCTQALLLGLRALHAAGHPAVAGRMLQVPQVDVLEPVAGASRLDPDTITVRWRTQWQRFDGKPYTDSYPSPYTQSESDLIYRVMWSGDGGASWTSALTEQPTAPGVWPQQAAERLADIGTGNESFTFPWPDTLPPGDYVFLVEAWRATIHMHSASHQVRIQIRRST